MKKYLFLLFFFWFWIFNVSAWNVTYTNPKVWDLSSQYQNSVNSANYLYRTFSTATSQATLFCQDLWWSYVSYVKTTNYSNTNSWFTINSSGLAVWMGIVYDYYTSIVCFFPDLYYTKTEIDNFLNNLSWSLNNNINTLSWYLITYVSSWYYNITQINDLLVNLSWATLSLGGITSSWSWSIDNRDYLQLIAVKDWELYINQDTFLYIFIISIIGFLLIKTLIKIADLSFSSWFFISSRQKILWKK